MRDTALTCSLCAETRPVAERLFAFCPECGKEIRRAAPVPHVEATLPPPGPFVAATVLPELVVGHAMVVPPPTVATETTTDRRATGIRRTAIAAATVAVVAAVVVSGVVVWTTGTPETPRADGEVDRLDDPGVAETPDTSTAIEDSGEVVKLHAYTQGGKNCTVFKENYFKRGNGQIFSKEHVPCTGTDGLY